MVGEGLAPPVCFYQTTRNIICKICSPLRLLREHQGAPLRVCAKSTFPAHRCDMARAQRNNSENTVYPIAEETISVSNSPDHTYQGAKIYRSGLDFSVGGEVGFQGATPLDGFFGSFLVHTRNEHKQDKNYRFAQSIFRLAAMRKRGVQGRVPLRKPSPSRSACHLPRSGRLDGCKFGAFARRAIRESPLR